MTGANHYDIVIQFHCWAAKVLRIRQERKFRLKALHQMSRNKNLQNTGKIEKAIYTFGLRKFIS
ncbi:MAG: hypothetical protein DWQ44_05040 [Bacteroidetes bacterium]|nr:MAG: hypothetical protein DWQ33_11685 [Bacteroidota bacterium]REK00741.1 MAG: hypothetical protein DWQ39_11360 [Bacteroidota bacterium]REK34989.1 MAG: hypothetical protein DWQ44_05040 [Bacteroidota bacterium]REK48213.1 MAG: hypothetical protein DWQ48_10305 [Bacteroidota bacterium]